MTCLFHTRMKRVI